MGNSQSIEEVMKQNVHFIGIGGVGMSALALILLERNVSVSGSDLGATYITEMLENAGALVYIGHASEHIQPNSTIIYTTGIAENNPEYSTAKALGCALLHRSDLLKLISDSYKMLAVAGTHGKTTTSALLTHVLKASGKDPAFAVGGVLPQYNRNGGNGKGEYFVIEACESDGTFLKYAPYGAIVTNIDSDHLDYFGTEKKLHSAFYDFIGKVTSTEHLFWCGDDPHLKQYSPHGISYGFSEECLLKISNYSQKGWQICFTIDFQGKHYENIKLPLIGLHQALNAAAVFGLVSCLGVPEEAIRSAFLTFEGVKRRCECKGEYRGILLYDDYAHHPVEIKTTLEGIRSAIGDARLIAVYQPHRFTRARDCLGKFKSVFDAADEVFVVNIYPAGESSIVGITDENVFDDIAAMNTTPMQFIQNANLVEFLANYMYPNDVLVTLGAGDITYTGTKLLSRFQL